jgi:ATP-dependent Clp protease ATP-binding subunit ClpA
MKKITLFARLKRPWQCLSVDIYTDKLAESGRSIVRESYEEARRLNHNQLKPEHALIAFANLQQEFFDDLLHRLNLDRQTVLQALSTGPNHHKSAAMTITRSLGSVLSNSLKACP